MANPNSAYGLNRAKEYIDEKEVYEEKVKYFTKKYADPNKMKNSKSKYDRTHDWDFNL